MNNGVVALWKTSAGTPSDGGGGGGKAVGEDDCDYDKDCNADTDNSDDDNESLPVNQRPERYFQYYMDKITNPAPA
ncbi:hypothetical protein DPMN_112690 [Dreissena polymorpha]|uniref:Uncharacterized protein n=1 Tax=Dreissena polymorpha TaxID=45954 RepID=A0A9D4QQ42_DREPO|nr:hypothetical protein DPMN_112690 [Dreissena polymorpha]